MIGHPRDQAAVLKQARLLKVMEPTRMLLTQPDLDSFVELAW